VATEERRSRRHAGWSHGSLGSSEVGPYDISSKLEDSNASLIINDDHFH
jgi:hypothetical protein